MRLLAQRLEHLSWTEVVPEECRFVEFFDRMDGFFMSGDLKFWTGRPDSSSVKMTVSSARWKTGRCQLVQEQGGYHQGR